MRLSLQELLIINTAAFAPTLDAAAYRLGMPLSRLMYHLNSVEARTGVRMVERAKGHGIMGLSAEAKQVLAPVLDHLKAIDQWLFKDQTAMVPTARRQKRTPPQVTTIRELIDEVKALTREPPPADDEPFLPTGKVGSA